MGDIAEIIGRLEKLNGPDRNLDREITAASYDLAWGLSPDTLVPPSYTSSIDDALTLVPDGRNWCIHTEPCDFTAYVVTVHCTEPHTDGPQKWECKYHLGQTLGRIQKQNGARASAAIALCIAALRAREKQ